MPPAACYFLKISSAWVIQVFFKRFFVFCIIYLLSFSSYASSISFTFSVPPTFGAYTSIAASTSCLSPVIYLFRSFYFYVSALSDYNERLLSHSSSLCVEFVFEWKFDGPVFLNLNVFVLFFEFFPVLGCGGKSLPGI